MAVIYKIVNVVTEDFYVGSAVKPKRRKWEHWAALKKGTHHCAALQAAWGVFGEDAFEFVVVEEVVDDSLLLVEDTYLLQHAGRPHCYNTALSTQEPASATPSVRAKIRASMQRLYVDKENHPRFGKPHTAETKAKLSASRKGKAAGEEHYRYGQTVSTEVRDKIGAAQRGKAKAEGRKVSEEGRAKIRANIEAGRSHKHWVGRTHTEEAKAKMSKAVFVMPDGLMFPSLTAVLERYKLKMPTLRRALVSGQPISKGPLKGYSFKYGGVAPTFTLTDKLLAGSEPA